MNVSKELVAAVIGLAVVTWVVLSTRTEEEVRPEEPAEVEYAEWGAPSERAMHDRGARHELLERSTLRELEQAAVLRGILHQGSTRVALLDGQLVREGDTVSGFRVRAIERDGVVVEDGAESVRIPLAASLTRARARVADGAAQGELADLLEAIEAVVPVGPGPENKSESD